MPSYRTLISWVGGNYSAKLLWFENEWNLLEKDKKILLQLIFFRYKKHFPKNYYLYFMLIYWLFYFKLITLTDLRLDKTIRDLLSQFYDSFLLEQQTSDAKEFVTSFLNLPDQLKDLKIVIKYTVLTWGEKTESLVWDMKKYLVWIWYLLPWISYKKMYKIEQVFQEYYFKWLYPNEYKEAHELYTSKLLVLDNWDKILVKVVNTLSYLLSRKWLYWLVFIREKTLFSFYNKLLRKEWVSNIEISDILWAKLLLRKESDIKTFLVELEKVYTVIKRKDYLSHEKNSGYRWYHIVFLYTFWNLVVPIELQMRTSKEETKINNWTISHFYYSLRENKWNKKFVEIRKGLELFNYLTKTNER